MQPSNDARKKKGILAIFALVLVVIGAALYLHNLDDAIVAAFIDNSTVPAERYYASLYFLLWLLAVFSVAVSSSGLDAAVAGVFVAVTLYGYSLEELDTLRYIIQHDLIPEPIRDQVRKLAGGGVLMYTAAFLCVVVSAVGRPASALTTVRARVGLAIGIGLNVIGCIVLWTSSNIALNSQYRETTFGLTEIAIISTFILLVGTLKGNITLLVCGAFLSAQNLRVLGDMLVIRDQMNDANEADSDVDQFMAGTVLLWLGSIVYCLGMASGVQSRHESDYTEC